MLSPDDFCAFFQETHGHKPFPWQQRLLRHVAETGQWPSVLDLPTGSGKTAAIDVAVFHLALEADRGEARRAPVRIAFVVDRRLVVDDAFERARKIAGRLSRPVGSVSSRVAEQLTKLASNGPPLIAQRLRGGIPRENDWARTPSQPTVLCSTVDQIGSRLLFRAYGVSDSMKPVHAGLIGSDCLILLDEAHLAEPFRQTLGWIQTYKSRNWCEVKATAPWRVALLTATPGQKMEDDFCLTDDDKSNPILKKRLDASKPARLVAAGQGRAKEEDAAEAHDDEIDRDNRNLVRRAQSIIEEVRRAAKHFENVESGASSPAIGVVVNRVARARAVFEQLKKEFSGENGKGDDESRPELLLMVGLARPLDRDEIAERLRPIRTQTWEDGNNRILKKCIIVVATQCIEAGVDIDLDGLITEAAPLDALRQRFGRLNRAGRSVKPYAAIVAAKTDLSSRVEDPVYGKTIKPAWDYLLEIAVKSRGDQIVDFGLKALDSSIKKRPFPDTALSPKQDAPVLLPAHLDLLSQTSPIPAPDPDIGLHLHGESRQPDSITVVWRADIDPHKQQDDDVRRLLLLVPPRSVEAIELPPWAVRCWLSNDRASLNVLADVAIATPNEEPMRSGATEQLIFRWKGDDERSAWIRRSELRPGDAIVIPASYGGVDEFGWNPVCMQPATDIGRRAAQPFSGRHFAVRVASGLLGDTVSDDALFDALARATSERWQDLRSVLLGLNLPQDVQDDLRALGRAKRKKSIAAYLDLYGAEDDQPRGVVFVAPLGINEKLNEEGSPSATEDDTIGSLYGFTLSLEKHSRDVSEKAEAFARSAGLPNERVIDLKLAGLLHDAGKADPRFQAWLHYGDPLGPDPDRPDGILAKSGRLLPRAARATSGLPASWRHEARSVRLARLDERFATATDPDLVLWLVGSHHGYGRPLFPHQDPTEQLRDVGPQSLSYDWNGLDWPTVFASLKARYGPWELARMEAILRLADHRASEERASEENGE
jgi:CRISPR-associated endonuclease/helicase Cas3